MALKTGYTTANGNRMVTKDEFREWFNHQLDIYYADGELHDFVEGLLTIGWVAEIGIAQRMTAEAQGSALVALDELTKSVKRMQTAEAPAPCTCTAAELCCSCRSEMEADMGEL